MKSGLKWWTEMHFGDDCILMHILLWAHEFLKHLGWDTFVCRKPWKSPPPSSHELLWPLPVLTNDSVNLEPYITLSRQVFSFKCESIGGERSFCYRLPWVARGHLCYQCQKTFLSNDCCQYCCIAFSSKVSISCQYQAEIRSSTWVFSASCLHFCQTWTAKWHCCGSGMAIG